METVSPVQELFDEACLAFANVVELAVHGEEIAWVRAESFMLLTQWLYEQCHATP